MIRGDQAAVQGISETSEIVLNGMRFSKEGESGD